MRENYESLKKKQKDLCRPDPARKAEKKKEKVMTGNQANDSQMSSMVAD